jgi:ribose transport system substrate-binding protein
MPPRSATLFIGVALAVAACSTSTGGSSSGAGSPSAAPPGASASSGVTPGASPSSGAAGKLKLGITIYPPTVSVVASAVNAAQAEAKAQGVDAVFAFAPDAATQQSAIESLLSQGVNVLAIDPNDSTAVVTGIKLANAANVPVIMWIAPANAGGTVAVNILSPDVKSANAMATGIFQNYMAGSGDFAFIQGDEVQAAFLAREKGMRDALANFPNVKLAALGIGAETADKANPVALDIITKNPNLKAIFADTDAMADGVYSAVESSGKTGQISVFGYNGSCPTLSSIWNGKIKGTLYQGWSGFGANVVDTAIKVFNKESVPPNIENPAYVIDKTAMQQIQAGTFATKDATLTASINEAITGKCP